MAVRFEEYASVVFRVCGVSQNSFTARATVVVVTHSKIVVLVENDVFVCAAEAVFFVPAAEVIDVTGIPMVQIWTRGRQLAILNNVVMIGVFEIIAFWLHFP